MTMIGQLYAKLGLDTTEWDRKLKTAGSSAKKLGKSLTMKLTAPITAIGVAVVKTFADFDSSLRNAASLVGATGDEMEDMEQIARDMGRETVFSATEAADAMYYMASAGWDVDKMGQAIKPTLDLAAATQSDLAFATEAVISTLNQFNLTGEDTERVTNVFAAAIADSQATLDKLKISMAYVGPVASGMNISLEDSTSLLALLYNNGIDASTAGTALRGAISMLSSPLKKMREKLDDLDISLSDVNPATNDFADILDTLQTSGADAGDILELFGKRAGPAMIKLVEAGGEAVRDFSGNITDTDKAAEIAAEQLKSLKNQFKLLYSKVQEVLIQFGELLLPVLESIISALSSAADWVGGLSGSMKTMVIVVAALAAAAGPLALAFGTLATLLPTMAAGFALLTGPVGAITLAIGIAVIAINDLVKTHQEAIQNMKDMTAAAQADLTTMEQFKNLWIAVRNEGGDALKQWDELMTTYGGNAQKIMTAVFSKEKYQAVRDLFEALETGPKQAEKPMDDLKSTTISLDGSLKDLVATGKLHKEMTEEQRKKSEELAIQRDLMKPKIKTLVTETDAYTKKQNALNTAFANGDISLLEYISSMNDAAIAAKNIKFDIEALEMAEIEVTEAALDTAEGWNDWVNLWGQINPQLKQYITGVGETGKTTALETKTAWDEFADGLQTKWASTIGEVLTGATNLKDGLKGIWDAILEQFGDMIGQMVSKFLVNFVDAIIDGATNAGKSIVENVGGALSEGASSVAGGISSVASGFGSIANIAANVVTAVASIANLFTDTGIGSTAEWHLEHIWISTKETRDFLFNDVRKYMIQEAAKMRQVIIDRLQAIKVYLTKVQPNQFNQLSVDLTKKLSQIRGDTKFMARALDRISKSGLAEGGIQWTPAWKPIAEHGPELVTPLDKVGQVFDKLKGGGGTTVNVNYAPVIKAMDAADVERFMLGPGKEALLKAIRYNTDGFARKSKEEYDKF